MYVLVLCNINVGPVTDSAKPVCTTCIHTYVLGPTRHASPSLPTCVGDFAFLAAVPVLAFSCNNVRNAIGLA